MSFLGAFLGTLTSFGLVYGILYIRMWQKERRVKARLAKLIGDFFSKTEVSQPPPAPSPPTSNTPMN
jgi:hypothetical protein